MKIDNKIYLCPFCETKNLHIVPGTNNLQSDYVILKCIFCMKEVHICDN